MKLLICSFNEAMANQWQQIFKDKFAEIIICREEKPLPHYASEMTGHNDHLILYHLKKDSNEERALRTFLKQYPSMGRMLVLANVPDTDQGIRLLMLGVKGYANAHLSADKLATIMEVVSQGEIWAGEQILTEMIKNIPNRSFSYRRSEELNESLTNREKQITDLVMRGKSNKEVANELFISERTVKAHLSSIFQKTETHSRFELSAKLQRL